MHICLIIGNTHPNKKLGLNVGGISNQILHLLQSYEKNEHIKISLVTKYSEFKPSSDRIKIYQIHKFNKFILDEIHFNVKSFISILKIHKREPINILNIHHFTIFKLVPIIIRLVFKIPILMKMPTDFSNYIRNIESQKAHNIFFKIYSYSWLKFFIKFLLKKINYIRAINDTVLNNLIELNYPRDRILKLPNGILLEKDSSIKKPQRNHTNYGFVGRLTGVKNLRFLMKVFKNYFTLFPLDKLNIYGEGPEARWILNFTKKHNLGENIILWGFQSDKNLIFSNLDVLINASFTEGISNSILEAFYTKTFVIASNVSGNKDLIRDKITGLIFDPYNSEDLLKQLLIYKENKIPLRNIIDNAQNEILNTYDIDLITKKIYQIIKSKINIKI